MPRYMCVKKCFQWGRLIHEGDIIELPVGTKVPSGSKFNKRAKVTEKVPYFRLLRASGKTAPVKTHLTAQEIKILKNRLSALYARTNLTPAEEAEKERIQDRLAAIDKGTSLGIRISKEEAIAKREKAVEVASGTRPMSMAETQAMKHKKFDDAKKEKDEKKE